MAKRSIKSKKTIVMDAIFSVDDDERLEIVKELDSMICKGCGAAIHPKVYHKCPPKDARHE